MPDSVMTALIGSVVTFLLASIFAEARLRYNNARREGIADTKATQLATAFEQFKASDFHEFKSEIKSLIDKLFSKIDSLIEARGTYPCQQLGIIGAMKSQVDTNTTSVIRLERRVWEVERFATARGYVPTQQEDVKQ